MNDIHPIADEIERVLIARSCWYERFLHEPVRTSAEASEVRPEYSLAQGTKALIVRAKKDGKKRFLMLVVPGNKRFDKEKLKIATGYSDVRFASEEEVGEITHGILPGGVPPWGQLFNLEVIVDTTVFDNERVIFNAGDKRVSIGMRSEDYRLIVNPVVADISGFPEDRCIHPL